jgi:hypothetical protein
VQEPTVEKEGKGSGHLYEQRSKTISSEPNPDYS